MERKLTANLSADVEGYSRLMGGNEEATVRTLTEYREAMGGYIERHKKYESQNYRKFYLRGAEHTKRIQ